MRQRREKRRGAIAILVAAGLVTLLGFVAVALEGGGLLDERRSVQAAADAAALSAADDLFLNWNTNKGKDAGGSAKASALNTAASNGYTNDALTSVVTVNIPPQSGTFVNQPGYAEVIVQWNQKRAFSSIFGNGDLPVRARAVARGILVPSNAGILVLDPHAPAAFQDTGNGNVNVTGGAAIIVNSDNAMAATTSGNGNVVAPNIYITGGYAQQGNGQFVGKVQTGVAPTPDPLANLPPPNPATLSVQSTSQLQISSNANATLQPGVYQGGIRVTGNGNVTLMPGIYYMSGGGFNIAGNGNVTGSGVMIYNAPSSPSDVIDFSGNGNLNITPTTSGTYQGIAIFQDRTATAPMSITGNGTVNTNLGGTVYAANAQVTLAGNGGLTGAQFISRYLTVSGNGDLNLNYNGGGAGTRQLGLVE